VSARTWPQRIAAFDRHRRAQCRLAWAGLVILPAARALDAKLRRWARGRRAGLGAQRVSVAVVRFCLRRLAIDRRVRRCDAPGDADAARALAAVARFDPDAVDWTTLLGGTLGGKLNALRHRGEE
jgi:hypothetical protein